MSEKSVWIVTGATNPGYRGVYHTDRDCHRLNRFDDDRINMKSRPLLADFREECQFCAGVVEFPDQTGRTNRELRDRLLEAAPEDCGLSPIGERKRGGRDE